MQTGTITSAELIKSMNEALRQLEPQPTIHQWGLGGFKILISPFCVKRIVRRVRGGFANRWLVREEIFEPTIFVNRRNFTIYLHPAKHAELDKAVRGVEVRREYRNPFILYGAS